MLIHKLITLCVLLTFFVGCASRTQGWMKDDSKLQLSQAEVAALETKAQSLWNRRSSKEKLMSALDVYKKLAQAKTNNYHELVRLSRGYYFLADAHMSDEEEKRKNWEIGTSWGEKAMATNEEFAKAVKAGEDFTEHLGKLSKKEIAAMYWTATNLGKWAKSTGIVTTLKYKNKIRTLIGNVEKMDAKFFYAAAYRYWGAYYAVAPSFAGGDMSKSKMYFERSIKIAPEYLGTRVLYAQYYATKASNPDLFKRQLKTVLSAKAEVKDIGPENRAEQAKAKVLLANIEEQF